MLRYAAPLQKLIGELERLPGIGPKSAQRLAFFLLASADQQVEELGRAVLDLKAQIGLCRQCHNYTTGELCPICEDPHRDASAICVVEQASDLMALERSGEYRGVYHVLGGALSPIERIHPIVSTVNRRAVNLRSCISGGTYSSVTASDSRTKPIELTMM